MPLFALPLAASSTTSHSKPTNTHPYAHPSLTIRKRKRSREPSPASSASSLSNADALPASTNPLSLTPDEIAQYKLAGLQLDEEIPAVKNWPHRGFVGGVVKRDRKGKGKERASIIEDEEDDRDEVKKGDAGGDGKEERAERGPRLRLQHLSVLTTILQRCLLEGDIQRASRAWAMLIRAQVGGRGVDLRGSGYWGIGAELLIRSLDRKRKYSYDEASDDEEEEEEEGMKRWGSKEGLEKARDYYERLILQHPYKRQFDGSVSALDFWPAMVGCEIYGIQFEEKEGLRRVAREEEEDEGGERSGSQSEESEDDVEDDDAGIDGAFAAIQRRKTRRMRRRAERRWVERDEIRKTALVASEKIAARLDDLMTTPPYSDSHNLLRLRGMIALYVGDLSVPEMPLGEANEEDRGEDDEGRRPLRSADRDTERRFLYRQRVSDHERGREKRKEEQERARKLFDRISREGGDVEDIKMPLEQDEDAEEFYDAEE
ncbi:hypothetical protein NA56DRAFT_64620 [Hyaloscypha hepaticicola]|uniref:Uncharacterized protein n=1 Tax=Hyaloscypha hepaticicola TaxID=2082293 RepID=A0A2J6QAE8_9HELO|nr:hypothetical protein NA56DRAFT_64620 [Hyaloscypha hepaticicola]